MHPTIPVQQERPFYPRWGSHIHSMGFYSEWYHQALFFYALNSKCQPRNLSGGRGRARAAAEAALPSYTLQHLDFCSAIWNLYCKYLYFKCPGADYIPFSLGEHRPSIDAVFELPTLRLWVWSLRYWGPAQYDQNSTGSREEKLREQMVLTFRGVLYERWLLMKGTKFVRNDGDTESLQT